MAEFKRLDQKRVGNLGNLGFLPLELCNKIYAFLLTDFIPPPIIIHVKSSDAQRLVSDFPKISHSIDTAILRVSRPVHLEAYDLMVKKHRFVHIRSRGVPKYLLSWAQVPIVTENPDHVSQFKGYVLEVTMTSHEPRLTSMPPGAYKPFEVMMLARDLDTLCSGLMDGDRVLRGFLDRVDLTLTLGLAATASSQARDEKYLASLEQYFSEKTQTEILQPFRDSLYDVQNIKVRGLVAAEVASSTCKGAASGRWGSHQELLDYCTARKEVGTQLFKMKEVEIARGSWLSDVAYILTLRTKKHWPRLVQEGGEPFISQLAELYFRLNLNCAHVFMDPEFQDVRWDSVVRDVLGNAHQAMTTGYWMEGFTWQPPRELRAKLHFRKARFLRLWGDLDDLEDAEGELDNALLICPNDPVILEERRLLSHWADETVMTTFLEQLGALPLGTPE